MFENVDIVVALQTGTTSVLLLNEERTEIEAVHPGDEFAPKE